MKAIALAVRVEQLQGNPLCIGSERARKTKNVVAPFGITTLLSLNFMMDIQFYYFSGVQVNDPLGNICYVISDSF